MQKEWLKLEGEAIKDDLQTGQVLAVLPTPPAPTHLPPHPVCGKTAFLPPLPPPTPGTTLPFALC